MQEYLDQLSKTKNKIVHLKRRKIKGKIALSGILYRTGNAESRSNWYIYSLIHIDNILIKKVIVVHYLAAFLDLGEKHELTFRKLMFSKYMLLLKIVNNDIKQKIPIWLYLKIHFINSLRFSFPLFVISGFIGVFILESEFMVGHWFYGLFALHIILIIKPLLNYFEI